MKTVHYYYENNKFFREDTLLEESEVEKEIGHFRYLKLKREGKCNVRKNSIENSNLCKLWGDAYSKADLKIIRDNRSSYKTYTRQTSKGIKHELWRKNKKYGYYNFISYIENLDEQTIYKYILNDIKAMREK